MRDLSHRLLLNEASPRTGRFLRAPSCIQCIPVGPFDIEFAASYDKLPIEDAWHKLLTEGNCP